MTQQISSYPYLGPNGSNSNMDDNYVNELISKRDKLNEQRRLRSALYNPKDGIIYLEDSAYGAAENSGPTNPIRWDQHVKVIDTKRHQELLAKSASGQRHANEDQVKYGYFRPEWQDEAARCDAFIDAHGAGVITSTEFPAITVTTVSNELLRNDLIVAQKYNLLGITTTINTDQLWVVYPEYTDTSKKVRGGLQENDSIDTVGPGAFTETRIGLEKSGVGIAFTEEFYMRQFTYPITQFLLENIANDFARVKHERLVALLPSFANITGDNWGAFTAANPHSDFRPVTDINEAKVAVNSDKIARADTIVSNENQWIDYDTNTWTAGFGQPMVASDRDLNDVIARPRGIPWAQSWYLNEDIPANTVYIFDKRAFVMIQGPRKTTQFQLYNPDQTVTMQKDWFRQHLRKSAWGRELVSV